MTDLNHLKQQILAKTPLDQLIGEQVTLQSRAGKKMGCCPFHAEKTPSFYLYDDHYHCFGCGAHGDAISYVRHAQGLGFIESLKWLANRCGVDTSELDRSKKDMHKWQESARKTRVLAEAQQYFTRCLREPQGAEARAYLEKRGFPETFWDVNGFGYSPDSGDALISHLKSLGYSMSEMEDVSLANSFRGRSFDFFRHRVMVPIRDVQGRLIAFGGRALSNDQQQKYKNSRYDKGSVLFGLDHARKIARSRQRAIVVEGYLDALKMRMSGFPETVACQGTALTPEHLRSLRSATSEVVLLFDGDKAGQRASLKTLENALDIPELRFKVAELPEGSDPDSFLESNGPEAMQSIIDQAGELLSWSIKSHLDNANPEAIPGMINKEIIPWLLRVPDPVNRAYLEDQVARISGVPIGVIRNAVNGKEAAPNRTGQKPDLDQDLATPVTAIDDESYEPAPLSPLAFEFAGHLFYGDPEDPELADLAESIRSQELEEDELWLRFMEELISALKNKKRPQDLEDSSWTLSSSPMVSELIEKFRRLKSAFETKDRKKIFERLQLMIIKNKIENTIASTKKRMNQLTFSSEPDQESLRDHAGSLMRLQTRLREVCLSLNQF